MAVTTLGLQILSWVPRPELVLGQMSVYGDDLPPPTKKKKKT